MFFILSKVLYVFIQPVNWVLFVLLWAGLTKKPVRRKRLLWAAFFMVFFFSNRMIFNQVVGWWEEETLTADQLAAPYDIGILLGGYSNSSIVPGHDRFNLSTRGNRFFNAYELYRTGKVRKLLLTGGTGSLLQNHPGEARLAAQLLQRLGVPDTAIIVENASRNTYENAAFSSAIVNKLPGEPSCLLITSAYHMRRAAACFRKTGLNCTPFSVDYLRQKPSWEPKFWLIPEPLGFYHWEAIIKEWLGYLAYKVRGYL